MTKQVQRRRGTAAQHTGFTGAEGEISVNTTRNSVHVHDGVTAGGIEAARADMGNVSGPNILSAAGITATTTELNFTSGVTSGIQTQLNSKAPINNATFTGTTTIPSATITGGTINGTTIGASTASTGAFTTLSASTSLTTPLVTNAGTVSLSATGANIVTASTNGVERLRITSAGSVGIGTNNPASILNVVGEQAIIAGGVGTGNLGIQIKGTAVTAIPAAQVQGYIATGQSDIGIAGDLLIAPRTNTTASVRFITGTTPAERMRITSAGLVGIGTSAPINTFHVDGAVRVGPSAGDITTPSGFLIFGARQAASQSNAPFITQASFDGAAQDLALGAHSGTGTIRFFTGASTGSTPFTGANTERLRITSAGNVGIGTSSPATRLDIGASQVLSFGNIEYGLAGGIVYPDIASGVGNLLFANKGYGLAAVGLGFYNAGTYEPVLTARTSGNVGIGTSSPASALEIRGVSIGEYFRAGGGTISDRSLQFSNFNIIGLSGVGHRLSVPNANGALAFDIGGTERARIDASGNLLVGTTTSSSASVGIRLYGTTAPGAAAFTADGTHSLVAARLNTNGDVAQFRRDTTTVGSISVTTTNTTYNTSSDYRLKEDVQPMVGSVDRLMALKPVNFAWKVDGSRVDGFLAHQAQEVVPEAVTGEKDGEEMQAIDHSKLVPLLTAALQEALTEIADLKARITALEA